jgi:hypothetical protein
MNIFLNRIILIGILGILGIWLPPVAGAEPKGQMASKPGARALALGKAIAGADRLEISPKEPVLGSKPDPTTIHGAAKIADLARLLAFDEKNSGSICACCGDYTLTFFKGGQVLAKFSHHHGQSLRWHGGPWKGDSVFTSAAAVAWPKWFDANGFPAFEAARQQEVAAAERERHLQEAFFGSFPASARKPYAVLAKTYGEVYSAIDSTSLDDDKAEENPRVIAAARGFLKACGSPFEAGMAICRALSVLHDPQNHPDDAISMEEQVVVIAFGRITGHIMPSVLEFAVTDPKTVIGAGRLFFGYRYHRNLPETMRDGLAPKFLRTTIERDRTGYARRAIVCTGEIATLAVAEVLRDVAAGKLKPAVPEQGADEEPGLRCLAALVLAQRGDAQAPALVAALADAAGASNQAALAIARSFLGDRDAIRPEIFRIRSFLIGYAGLAALERQGDKAALDVVITGGLEHSWALVNQEAVHVVQRMTGLVWYHAQPYENEVWYGKDIREWWKNAKATWQPPAPGTPLRDGPTVR